MTGEAGGMNLTDKTTAYQGKTFAIHYFSPEWRRGSTVATPTPICLASIASDMFFIAPLFNDGNTSKRQCQ
jgi:hypothetical protein